MVVEQQEMGSCEVRRRGLGCVGEWAKYGCGTARSGQLRV
jgi:hypothetical protein